MKHKTSLHPVRLALIGLIFITGIIMAQAQTTAFTYQGKLSDGAMSANGSYDLGFALFDAASGGTQIGSPLTRAAVSVTNGVFTVQLNFGAAAFPGADRFLEIAVKHPAETDFTTLNPRQQVTSTPYAVQSLNAANAAQLGGVTAANYVQTNGSGANLTNLNAANIASGTLDDARLSANVAFRSQANTFTGNQTINGSLTQNGTTANLSLTNGFVTSGTVESGTIPATGSGTRMMFYPGKAAFRAGFASSTEWDDGNTGQFSVAMGLDTLASGRTSFAAGVGSTATGDSSVAIGNVAIASGNGSVALGYNTTASGFATTALGFFSSTNEKSGSFVYGDASTFLTTVSATTDNQFVVRAQNIWFGKNDEVINTDGRFLETSTGAYLSNSGIWTDNSSVNLKTNFAALDSREVLRKILNLKIQTWNYKADAPNVRHIGVMAQDFYKAFNVGADDEHLTAVDTAGVTMAAIQGLNAELTEELKLRDVKISNQEIKVVALETNIERQQKQIAELKQVVCTIKPDAEVCWTKNK